MLSSECNLVCDVTFAKYRIVLDNTKNELHIKTKVK